MKAKYQPRPHGFTLVELLVVIVIIAALAALSAPMILKQRKAADRTEAISNIKQISLSLQEFDADYQGFPDNSTAESVKEATNTDLNLSGTYSNDYFRQLIAGTGLKSEKAFYCKTPYTKKPDDQINGSKALDKGEVGFGYIMASQSEGQSSSGLPARPVVVAPLLNAQNDWTFDPEPFDRAIVLRLDSSASALPIKEDTKKVSSGSGGRNIEDTGENSVWGTSITPVLRAPEKRGA